MKPAAAATPKKRGYSLIEVSITIVAIAVLATMAMPSYQRVVRKTQRTAAIALLLDLRLRQEKYRADNASYAGTLDAIGAPASGSVVENYVLSIVGSSATAYQLRASARETSSQQADAQNGVSCAELTMDQAGTLTPSACGR